MPRGELLKKLFYSYSHGDSDAFQKAATEIIRDEESKNNRVLASALRRNLGHAKLTQGSPVSDPARDGSRRLTVLPFEKEKQLPLVETIIPERKASDLILTRSNQHLLLSLVNEFRQRDTLGAHGLRPRSRLLFCGPPGCGKTLCAEVFANEVKLPLLVASMDVLVSSLLGETATNLRKIFDYAAAQPVVLLLDEFDAIARLRDDETLNGELRRVVNSLLTLIEKFRGQGFVIAATNHERQLDPAIWRRFDEVVFFERPNRNEIIRLLNLKFRNFGRDFESSEVASELKGFSHADIERVCLNAIRRSILSGQKVVTKRRLLRSIALESRRGDIAQQHQS
ncbi:AAA family ATPase [Granulicella sp. L60]|uniref:AAA family ATPase n=1 Tax=Granulicella sp. L60 TaxID=1641866 RepID=UPI00131B0A9C|nr:ATP-binding protein [Granulicella sp. L60]